MEKIGKGTYTGYLWYSNATKPEVWIGKETEEILLDENFIPFIIEGQLYYYDEGSRTTTSYSIRFADGRYYVIKTILSAEDLQKCDIKHFVPHRMQNVARLVFAQTWKTVCDEEGSDNLCEGMETQVPDKLIFCGLELKEEKQ